MIARTANGYTLSSIKNTKLRRSNDTPSINGEMLADEERPLKPHDVLELAGTQMEFFYVT
jgi:hypothetical protein